MRSTWKFICASEIDPVRAELLCAQPLSNRQLAERLSWTECRTSRFVDQLVQAGKVRKTRAGQAVTISLA
jgi:predicted transcriptional regulator